MSLRGIAVAALMFVVAYFTFDYLTLPREERNLKMGKKIAIGFAVASCFVLLILILLGSIRTPLVQLSPTQLGGGAIIALVVLVVALKHLFESTNYEAKKEEEGE